MNYRTAARMALGLAFAAMCRGAPADESASDGLPTDALAVVEEAVARIREGYEDIRLRFEEKDRLLREAVSARQAAELKVRSLESLLEEGESVRRGLQERINRTEFELNAAKEQSESAQSMLDSKDEQLSHLRRDFDRLRREQTSLQADLDRAKARADSAERERNRLRDALTGVEMRIRGVSMMPSVSPADPVAPEPSESMDSGMIIPLPSVAGPIESEMENSDPPLQKPAPSLQAPVPARPVKRMVLEMPGKPAPEPLTSELAASMPPLPDIVAGEPALAPEPSPIAPPAPPAKVKTSPRATPSSDRAAIFASAPDIPDPILTNSTPASYTMPSSDTPAPEAASKTSPAHIVQPQPGTEDAPRTSALAIDRDLADASAALDEGEFERACEVYERILDSSPDDPIASVGLTETLMLMGDADGALRRAKSILRGDPDNVHRLFLAGRAAAQAGHPDDALLHLERASRSAPDRTDIRHELASVLFELRRFQEASDAFLDIARLDPGDGEAWFNACAALLMTNDPPLSKASSYYERAVNLGEASDERIERRLRTDPADPTSTKP